MSITDKTENSSSSPADVFTELKNLPLFDGSVEDYKKWSSIKSSKEEKEKVAPFLPPRPRGLPINWDKLKGTEAKEFLRLFRLREKLFSEEGKTLSQNNKDDHKAYLTLGNKVYLFERAELSDEEKKIRKDKNAEKRQLKKKKLEEEKAAQESDDDSDASDDEEEPCRRRKQPNFIPIPIPQQSKSSGVSFYFMLPGQGQ